MSVQLPGGRTAEELVEFILAANQDGRQHEALIAELASEFRLSNEDAELSVDRVGGGIVRAATGSGSNNRQTIGLAGPSACRRSQTGNSKDHAILMPPLRTRFHNFRRIPDEVTGKFVAGLTFW